MQKNLTPQKKKMLDFINLYSGQKGYSPSIPEIAKHFRLANSTVHQHLDELKKSSYLKKTKNQRRSIDIQTIDQMVKIPLLGTIAAGQPIEAIQDKEMV